MPPEAKKKKKKVVAKKEEEPVIKQLGPYQLGGSIGQGAFGTVYKGIDIQTGNFVAVKEIPFSKVNDIESIQSEINLLKQLNHPNIVKYIDTIQNKNTLNIITEYVENGSLQSLVKKFGVLPESLVQLYVIQILNGLIYLHSQGVIHRDIKGANILVASTSGHVKLADFGVSTKMGDTSKPDADEDVAGTPYWIAPEIIEMKGSTPESDIWSLGCTVIELLTGSPPYFDLAPIPALWRIVQDDHPPLPSGITPACQDFLMRCFQKNPSLRATAQQLLVHKWLSRRGMSQKVDNTLQGGDVMQQAKQFNEQYSQAQEPKPSAPSLPKKPSAPAPLAPDPTKTDTNDALKKWAESDSDSDDWDTPAPKAAPAAAPKPVALPKPQPKPAASAADITKWSDDSDSSDLDDFGTPPPKKDAGAAPAATGPLSTPKVPEPKPKNISDFMEKEKEEESDDDFDLGEGGFGAIDLRKRLEERKHEKTEKMLQSGKVTIKKGTAFPHADITSTPAVVEFQDDDDDWDDDFDEPEELDPKEEANRRRIAAQKDEMIALLQKLDDVDQLDTSTLTSSLTRLNEMLTANPQFREELISNHSMLPLTEILEKSGNDLKELTVKLINTAMASNQKIQEIVSMFGLTPVVLQYAAQTFPLTLRSEVAMFAHTILATSESTFQMFIASRCLPLLCSLLDGPFAEVKHLFSRAVKCVSFVLSPEREREKFMLKKETQAKGAQFNNDTHTKLQRNDICRLFCKDQLLSRLAKNLAIVNTESYSVSVREDDRKEAAETLDCLINIISIFSNNDKVVSLHVAKADVLKPILDVIPNLKSEDHQYSLLTSIRYVATNQSAAPSFQNIEAIPQIVRFFDLPSERLQIQLVMIIFYISRLSQRRADLFALHKAAPKLINMVNSNSAVSQLAFQVVSLFTNTALARQQLWAADGVSFFVNLLTSQSLRSFTESAFKALNVWLISEPNKLGPVLSKEENLRKLLHPFTSETTLLTIKELITLLPALNEMIGKSTMLNKAIGKYEPFWRTLLDYFDNPNFCQEASLTAAGMRIITSLYSQHSSPQELIVQYNLYPLIQRVSNESQVLSKKLAETLLIAFNCNQII